VQVDALSRTEKTKENKTNGKRQGSLNDFFRQPPGERTPDVTETMGASCFDFQKMAESAPVRDPCIIS